MKFSLDSIIIFVRDVESAKNFYMTNFDLEVVEEIASEWSLLNAGNSNIGLHAIPSEYLTEDADDGTDNKNTKLVFETAEDIVEIRNRLIANQVKMKEVTTWEGYEYRVCDGEDLEGNVFQIKQRKYGT